MLLISALIQSFSFAQASPAIGEARKSFLEQGRKQALTIIEKSLRDSKARVKLLAEGEKLATRFKMDEAQREFEMGESLYFSKQKGALDHYRAAEKLEPDNIQVGYAKLRYFLSQSKCGPAKKELLKLKKVWRHAKLMPYFRLRVFECEGKSLSLARVTALKKLPPYDKKLKIQALVDKGRGAEALALAKQLSVKEKAFSEIFYWLFKAGEIESEGRLAHLRKYLKLCQSYGAVERRSFELEPLLCEKTEEAQKMVRARESGGV